MFKSNAVFSNIIVLNAVAPVKQIVHNVLLKLTKILIPIFVKFVQPIVALA